MNTKALNSLAELICRTQEQDRTPMGIAFAIDSAGRHMSPEMAAEQEQLRNDITGACLARWEEEQENARLRLALESAKRGRRELRAQVAALLEERHVTNEALRLRNTQRGDVELLVERERQCGEERVDIADVEAALSLGLDDGAEAPFAPGGDE